MGSSEDRPRRVDIGFSGGQVLELRLDGAAHEGLRRALERSGETRWHELHSEDSELALDLTQVVYVRRDAERRTVGF